MKKTFATEHGWHRASAMFLSEYAATSVQLPHMGLYADKSYYKKKIHFNNPHYPGDCHWPCWLGDVEC